MFFLSDRGNDEIAYAYLSMCFVVRISDQGGKEQNYHHYQLCGFLSRKPLPDFFLTAGMKGKGRERDHSLARLRYCCCCCCCDHCSEAGSLSILAYEAKEYWPCCSLPPPLLQSFFSSSPILPFSCSWDWLLGDDGKGANDALSVSLFLSLSRGWMDGWTDPRFLLSTNQ